MGGGEGGMEGVSIPLLTYHVHAVCIHVCVQRETVYIMYSKIMYSM